MDDVLSLMVIEAIYNRPTEIPIRSSWLRSRLRCTSSIIHRQLSPNVAKRAIVTNPTPVICHIKPILRSRLGYFMSESNGQFTIQQLFDFLEKILIRPGRFRLYASCA